MKIKLHVVLFCNGGNRRPRFKKTFEDFEVDFDNFESLLAGSISMLIIFISHTLTFKPRDWDRRNGILNTEAQMHSSECGAYQQSLIADGWEEIL